MESQNTTTTNNNIPPAAAFAGDFEPTSNSTNNDSLDAMAMLTKPVCTLDEPVSETIMRDVRAVASKLRVVMLPLDRKGGLGYMGVTSSEGGAEEGPGENQQMVINRLKEWDLWGPLIVCLTLSVILSFKAPPAQASTVFATVFVSVWAGAAIVTINAQLLGGTISFFQSVCVLGYCVFPLTIAALIVGVLRLTWFGVIW
eukprot:CAMPEP_0172495104 /NCGR_PEP_ID=MMETSP1066-20121228/64144_1 /TAXON_ID=671091 /ORGANISM="Coscinodiscus wailesii, Strain CCMP2513" /LENGTH=199 /DNA_ID=CAMNT_0013266575 /DNA_START=187 /DNA_END=783 /DNA_ORIENTATION=+